MKIKNDPAHRLLLTTFWLLALYAFYKTCDDAAFVNDLWGSQKLSKIESNVATSPTIHPDSFKIYQKGNSDDIEITFYRVNTINLPASTPASTSSECNDELFIALKRDLNAQIRFEKYSDYFNNPTLIKCIWDCIDYILFFTLLANACCMGYLYKINQPEEQHPKWFMKTPIFIIGVIAFIHAFFIYAFGGILISPFGIISTSIIPISTAHDIIKWNKEATKSRKRFFIIFLPTILFFLSTVTAHFLYKRSIINSNYEFLVSEFFKNYTLLGINWATGITLLSLILGIFTINLRIDDDTPTKLDTTK